MVLFESHGASETARILGIAVRNVYDRRKRLEKIYGLPIIGPNERSASNSAYPKRVPFEIQDGIVLIGSDAHYWPGEASTAHRAFVRLIEDLKPKLVILNGDVLDGARISRFPRSNWNHKPTLKEELEAVEERTDEIAQACKKSKRLWILGNHCMRFESKLANNAHDFEGVRGFSLREHFPLWDFALSTWINNNVVVKHRFKGGIHATHNNTLWAGKSIFTGHLHALKVTPFDDYNGTRYGGDTGTLSDPYGEHADYTEDNPLNHRSGFFVLTFHKGKLLWPEIVAVLYENHVQFRGQVISV